MLGKSRNILFILWFVGREAAGAEPCAQMRNEQLHAAVARSTFPSQNAQNTSVSNHSWKFGCRKMTRRCGGKHVSKSKRNKTDGLGQSLAVRMSKKFHFVVARMKSDAQNTPGPNHFWKFRCQRMARGCGRSTFPSENVKNMKVRTRTFRWRPQATVGGIGPTMFMSRTQHMSKWKKNYSFGSLFGRSNAETCTAFWREAHF